MINFSIFNIPVRVLPWFWVTLVLIGSRGHMDSRQDILEILLFLIAGFLSILIHELGHGLTARHFGNQVHIVLQAFGGYAAYTGPPMTRPRSFAITAAGPAVQIVFGLLIFLIMWLLPQQSRSAEYFMFILGAISVFWAVINLVPILPLDGGRLVEALLGPARIKTTLWVSVISAAVVCLLSFTIFWQPFVGIFVAFFGYQSFKAIQERSLP